MALALDGSAHVNFTSGTSGSLSLSTTNAPDIILVCIQVNNTTVASVTAPGLTFTLRKHRQNYNNPYYLDLWYAVASSPLSSTTITVTLNAATTYCTVDAFGVSGADTTTIFDPNTSLPASIPGEDIAVSTSNANDFIFGIYRFRTTTTPTAGSGWTQISGANYQLVEYQIVTSAQSNLDIAIGTGSGDVNAGIGDAIVAASGKSLALDGSAHVNVTSGTSASVSLTTANANDVIIIGIQSNNATVSSVTAPGLTFTLRKRQQNYNNPYYLDVWYAVAASALSSTTITVTLSTSTTYCTIDAFGVSGADTTKIFDSNPALPAAIPGEDIAVSTSYPNDFIFGVYRFTYPSPTAGSGWTQISGADYQLVEYQIATSIQSNLDVAIGTGSGDVNAGIGDAIMAYGVLTTRSGSASKGRAAGTFAAALSGRSAAAGTARGGISVGNLIALVARSGAAAAARAAGVFTAVLSGCGAAASTARPAARFTAVLAVRSGAMAIGRAASAFAAVLLGRSTTAGSARAAASGTAALGARGTASSTARGSINFGVVALIARSGAAAIARAASAFAAVLSGRGEAAGTAHGTAAGAAALSARGAAVGIAHGNLNLGNLIALVARSGTTAMGRAVGAFAAVLSGRSTTVGSAHAAASGAAALSARGNAAGTARPAALFAVVLAVRSGAAAAARAVSAFTAVLLGRSMTAGSAQAAASGTTALTARNTLTLTARGQPQAAVPLVVMARSFAVSLLRAILRTPPAYQGAHLINDQMAATTVINDQMRST